MKKLHCLKPEQHVCFLDQGRGERVTYLKISDELNEENLRQDVESGALYLENALKQVEKAKGMMSRVIVLRGNNEENLYMAASYLAGVCNEWEGRNGEDFEDDEYDEASMCFEDYEYEEDNDPEEWFESPANLPLIEMNELQMAGQNENYSPFGGDFMSLGVQSNPRNQPYWKSCRKEPVAVIVREGGFYCSSFSPYLERFQYNRHLFLLILEGKKHRVIFDSDEEGQEEDYLEQKILQFVLETTADIVWTTKKEKELEKYRDLQFENWVETMGMQLTAKFPKDEISKRIIALRDDNKSALMERVLKYVQKERRKENKEPLTEEEFDILRKFKSISEKDPEKIDGTSIQKMEKELVGMEKVKEQIRNLVQTMKYGKYREKMGLGKSGFHNVHLMIGAPGTAKTSMAKLLGNMMCEEGLLSDNRFISINGADLKGKYVGHSAPKTKALFEQYDIILIDEAYSLTAGDNGGLDSFSQEALAQLMIELEEHATDKLVLFAGYGGTGVEEKDNKMKNFLDANPGLKSRINTTIFFESYTPQEMVRIVRCQAIQQKFILAPEADALIQDYFAERVKASDFGNGREARVVLENAVIYAASRVMALPEKKRTKKMLQELTVEDIGKALARLREGNCMQKGRERKVCGF